MAPRRRHPDTAEKATSECAVAEAIDRGILEIKNNRITYHLGISRSYAWTEPEEWVRARTIAFSSSSATIQRIVCARK